MGLGTGHYGRGEITSGQYSLTSEGVVTMPIERS